MGLHLKEAAAIASGIYMLFYIPIQTRRIVGGWVPANFTGNAADYPAFWAKKAIGFMCFAIGIGVVLAALAAVEDDPRDWVPELAIAAIWFVIAAMTYFSRRQIIKMGGTRT